MAIELKSGATADIATIEATNKAVRVASYPPDVGATGGFWTVTGGTSAVVAAALAGSTMLMSARSQATATKEIFITRLQLEMSVGTVGASAAVSGLIGLQRFTAQTPTGGTARTPNRQDASIGGASTDLTDVRDSNAALTGTAPTFGTVVAMTHVPVLTVGVGFVIDWNFNTWGGYPLVLAAGDGIALRTQSALAATQTWQYSYLIEYFERA